MAGEDDAAAVSMNTKGTDKAQGGFSSSPPGFYIAEGRVAMLRAAMDKRGADLCMVTTEDAYLATLSTCDYWRSLRWLTGFPGTLGYVLVTREKFAFFTDARYIATVRSQIRVDGAELYDITESGADFYLKWLVTELSDILNRRGRSVGVKVALDGRTVSAARMKKITDALANAGLSDYATLDAEADLIGEVWADRPAPAYQPIFDHHIRYAGSGRREKISAVREAMKERGCDHYIVGTMEGVAWLTNMRGRDVLNPLFMSHALFTPQSVKLFAKIQMIPEALQKNLIASGYELFDIAAAGEEIGRIPAGATVFYDEFRTNHLLFQSIPGLANGKKSVKSLNGFDIINDLKAVKNPVEIENLRAVHKLEGVALVRILKFLKEQIANRNYSEYDLDDVLEEIHRRSGEFLCNANEHTMFAYMANGAKPHYSPRPETAAIVRPEGIMVMDVWSHYYGGTTDLTRTVKLGPSRYDAEIRRDYTLVLRSMMALSKQVFRQGTDGAYLDSVPRSILWNERIQYGYGTGHGIGYCICVNEGPQFIAEPSYKKEWAFCDVPLKPGMVMSDEPGIYREGRYGIRLENNMVVVEDREDEYGKWYRFETLSYCPFEPELIDTAMLSVDERTWLDNYNAKTLENLSPYLDDEEKRWLEKMTQTVAR